MDHTQHKRNLEERISPHKNSRLSENWGFAYEFVIKPIGNVIASPFRVIARHCMPKAKNYC